MSADCFEDTTLLLGVGPPRTASKWLSHYCEAHPQILMSPIRVLHYFDSMHGETERDFNQIFIDRLARAEAEGNSQNQGTSAMRDRVRMIDDPDAFIDYYRSRWSGQRVLADITPSYARQHQNTFKAMIDAHRKVRILVTLRNPIDRFWSALSRKQLTDDPGFLAEKLARSTVLDPQGITGASNYATILERLDSSVAEHQYKAVFFERLLTKTGIDEFCDWLGIDRVAGALNQPENKSTGTGPSAEQRRQIYHVLAPTYQYMQNRYGADLPESWQQDIELFG